MKKLLESRDVKLPAVRPWEAEVNAVYSPDATIGDLVYEGEKVRRGDALPVALNTAGVAGVEGPTEATMPYVTQPAVPLDMIGQDGMRIPLVYLYAGLDGEVALRVDDHILLQRGIAYPVTDQATWADGTQQGARVQVSKLVTDLTREAAVKAYKEAWQRVSTAGESYSIPSWTRDEFVQAVLGQLVPSYDWSKGPGRDPRLNRLWRGVSLMGQIAYQDYWVLSR
jgi:hypothetical protein